MSRAAACLLALAAACDAPPSSLVPDASAPSPASPSRAVLSIPRDGHAPPPFYDLPYPSDLRLTEDGRVDLSQHPRTNPLLGLYLDAITATQRGFGRASAIYLRFDAPIDERSLPDSPYAAQLPGSAVYLVDVDPRSPRRGQTVPIATRFSRSALAVIDENFLVAQPFPGVLLADHTTYALVATRRLLATDGNPVEPAADLTAVIGAGPPTVPELARARTIYQPLIDWLDEPGGDERADVVSATVFTTQDTTGLLGRIRQVIWQSVPAPIPRGVAIRAQTGSYAWYDGVYDGPIFQAGTVPYLLPADGGGIQIDPVSGDPILQRLDALRFSFTLPLGPLPAGGWPVVIYAHGTGGDYHTFVDDGTAGRLAAVGLACISIDQVLHGARNTTTPPEVAFFNYQNPYSARDNTLQGALDDFQVVRLVLGFDYTEPQPGGRTIRFDPDRVSFFGHSQGSLTGIPFVAHEPTIKAAVFSGAGGLLYQALLHKTEPIDITAIVALIIRDQPLDQFHPIINLLQAYMEPADSAAYADLLRVPPDDRPVPTSMFISQGLVDHYVPVEALEALAVATQIDLVAPVLLDVPGLSEAGGALRTAPLSDNRGAATAALLQYDSAPGSDGHFVVFDVPAAQKQSIDFLSTMAATGTATVVAP